MVGLMELERIFFFHSSFFVNRHKFEKFANVIFLAENGLIKFTINIQKKSADSSFVLNFQPRFSKYNHRYSDLTNEIIIPKKSPSSNLIFCLVLHLYMYSCIYFNFHSKESKQITTRRSNRKN